MCYEERFFARWAEKRARQRERSDTLTGRVPPNARPDPPKPEPTTPKRPVRELETV